MKEIIWIYGSSASGKETFLNQLQDNSNTSFLKKLNLKNKNIQILEQSINLIGQFDNDPKQKLRLNFKNYISNLIKQDNKIESILIKGQDYDLENKTPQKIKDIFPNFTHRIIFLHCDFEILYKRVKNKSWWTKDLENQGIQYFKNWLIKEQLPELIKLNKIHKFEILTIDSSTKEYNIINFPKELIK